MYDALIAYVESAVFTAVNQIQQSNPSGMHQARMIATTLISLTRTNPGMVILMCGDFLTQEDERLQHRLNLLFSKLRTQLKQSLSLAVAQMEIFSDYDVYRLEANCCSPLFSDSGFLSLKASNGQIPNRIQ